MGENLFFRAKDLSVKTWRYQTSVLLSVEKGIVLRIPEKWIRRKNLDGHYFKVATLEDKPYVDLIKSNITGFEMNGIFGDVFNNLKVSNFVRNDLSVWSTETKNQNIFCWCKWEFDDFFIHFEKEDKKTEG